MAKITALMRFLAGHAKRLGAGEHSYIVGGAVRNHLLGLEPKDIDIVIDSIALKGKDSAWFAQQLEAAIPVRTNFATNQYGVAILTVAGDWKLDGYDLKGEVIEIANARKESYGGVEGKGYKPHLVEPATIQEDLFRREFTFNTLLWRLGDLEDGPDGAEVLDLLGVGQRHLVERLLTTPTDPDKTFSDDPTRMLRAVKFVAKYGFMIDPNTRESIVLNAPKLAGMPWDAVRQILVNDILEGPEPRRSVALLRDLGLAEVLREMLQNEKGFRTALSRSIADQEIHLIFDLIDLGWPVRTPVSVYSPGELQRLREILPGLLNSEVEKHFLGSLKKPPIDQLRLFETFGLEGNDRAIVVPMARTLLLTDPNLADDPTGLERQLEEEIRRRLEVERASS